jgi:hypothetical protein
MVPVLKNLSPHSLYQHDWYLVAVEPYTHIAYPHDSYPIDGMSNLECRKGTCTQRHHLFLVHPLSGTKDIAVVTVRKHIWTEYIYQKFM